MATLLTTICNTDNATCLSLYRIGSTRRNQSAIIRQATYVAELETNKQPATGTREIDAHYQFALSILLWKTNIYEVLLEISPLLHSFIINLFACMLKQEYM